MEWVLYVIEFENPTVMKTFSEHNYLQLQIVSGKLWCVWLWHGEKMAAILLTFTTVCRWVIMAQSWTEFHWNVFLSVWFMEIVLIHEVTCFRYMYRKTSNTRCTLVGNKIVNHSRYSYSIACRRCSNYIFILDLTSGFKGFGKDSRKTVQESFKCWDLVRLILETWR